MLMMCFKDMTFCLSDCTNTKCFRHYSETVVQAAEKWWGGPDAPIAVSDFSVSCDDYKKPKEGVVK